MELKETAICRLCLEPITNYICVECLFSSIRQWLLSKDEDEVLSNVFQKHESLKKILSSDSNGEFCIKCKRHVDEIACPCCYFYEIYSTIKSIKPELAEEFEKTFNFDLNFHHGYSQLNLWQSLNSKLLRKFQASIIVSKESKSDFNICEICGQASDNLKEVNGSWICESCRD